MQLCARGSDLGGQVTGLLELADERKGRKGGLDGLKEREFTRVCRLLDMCALKVPVAIVDWNYIPGGL